MKADVAPTQSDAPEAPSRRQQASWPFAFAALAGGALVFFLEPEQGRRRRALLRDRAYGLSRDAGQAVDRATRFARAQAYGMAQKLTHPRPGTEVSAADDVVLV